MARRLLHRRRPLAPAAASLFVLLLADSGLLLAVAGATGKKVGMRMRVAEEEEARWMDRFAETHEPLDAPGGGPLLFRRASAEEARWMGRFNGGPEESGEGGNNVLEFDEDNPYYQALQAWVQRLIKQRGGIKIVDEDEPRVVKDVQDL